MKLPDKLYINKYMIRPGMLYPAEFPPDNPEEEYIRKDALIEWAKKHQNDSATIVADDTWQEVIDKINSL